MGGMHEWPWACRLGTVMCIKAREIKLDLYLSCDTVGIRCYQDEPFPRILLHLQYVCIHNPQHISSLVHKHQKSSHGAYEPAEFLTRMSGAIDGYGLWVATVTDDLVATLIEVLVELPR